MFLLNTGLFLLLYFIGFIIIIIITSIISKQGGKTSAGWVSYLHSTHFTM